MRATSLLLVLVALVLSACGPDQPDVTGPSYTPVPDDVLFARVSALPGVAAQHLEYLDSFANPNGYSGTVDAKKGVDPRELLDAVLAVLRTGHPDAALDVSVSSRSLGYQIGPDFLGLFLKEDFDRRYGPQPGDGTPPPSLPASVRPLPSPTR